MHFSILEHTATPEYPSEKESLNYAYIHSSFGKIIVLSTKKAILRLGLETPLSKIQKEFPLVKSWHYSLALEKKIKTWLQKPWKGDFTFYLKGTTFQKKVWRTLLHIPFASSTSYGFIAKSIGKAKAVRAVGTAVGKNPIALLIPCHRVILGSGKIGSYYWGVKKKISILNWEQKKYLNNN